MDEDELIQVDLSFESTVVAIQMDTPTIEIDIVGMSQPGPRGPAGEGYPIEGLALDDLNDVSAASPLEDQVLRFNEFGWSPATVVEDKTFTKVFTNESEVDITHNLGKYPSVSVIDSAGDEVEGYVEYTGPNTLLIRFTGSFTGIATLN